MRKLYTHIVTTGVFGIAEKIAAERKPRVKKQPKRK